MQSTTIKNGVLTSKTYTGYYDRGIYLDKKNIGFNIVLDHYKKETFPLYQLRYKLGLLGADDIRAEAKTTIYLINFSNKPKKFQLIRVSGFSNLDSEEIIIPPYKKQGMTIRRIILGKRFIGNYSKKVELEISYKIDGKKMDQKIVVPRITKEEANRYYGRNGEQPYPWVKDRRL